MLFNAIIFDENYISFSRRTSKLHISLAFVTFTNGFKWNFEMHKRFRQAEVHNKQYFNLNIFFLLFILWKHEIISNFMNKSFQHDLCMICKNTNKNFSTKILMKVFSTIEHAFELKSINTNCDVIKDFRFWP